jgi:ABC-type nickel/cobalt efflux system permease component RcnA
MSTTEIISVVRQGQHLFNDMVLSHMEAIKQEHTFLAYAGLILVGLVYGIVHAIGPGHGKVIVSSYLMANENSLKRGLVIVALSSLLQAITAIVLVFGYYYVLQATRTEAEHAAGILEACSYALIGALGCWLLARGVVTLKKAFGLEKRHHEGHHHHHSEEDCGHAHAPTADQLSRSKSFASIAAMILSVGIRPCTGALLLLFFACMFDLAWPGILATLAMAIGTAATTGILAILTVKSRDLALSFVKKSDRSMLLAHAGLRIAGGAFILLMAGLFLTAQLGGEQTTDQSQPPLFKALK